MADQMRWQATTSAPTYGPAGKIDLGRQVKVISVDDRDYHSRG
ncbi:hypothetical protein [Mycobacterium sp. 1423905.2]|nr:hypothetical protein [Mycobacterium sp. 1423905.2]